jgi:hypothetical protein
MQTTISLQGKGNILLIPAEKGKRRMSPLSLGADRTAQRQTCGALYTSRPGGPDSRSNNNTKALCARVLGADKTTHEAAHMVENLPGVEPCAQHEPQQPTDVHVRYQCDGVAGNQHHAVALSNPKA